MKIWNATIHTMTDRGVIENGYVCIEDGKITAVESGRPAELAPEDIDAAGSLLLPGFIDAHMHIESCMAAPGELAKVLAKAGTTTIIADPHEIVNVSGTKGMDYFLKCAAKLLVNVFFMVPSAVPATDVETNG